MVFLFLVNENNDQNWCRDIAKMQYFFPTAIYPNLDLLLLNTSSTYISVIYIKYDQPFLKL